MGSKLQNEIDKRARERLIQGVNEYPSSAGGLSTGFKILMFIVVILLLAALFFTGFLNEIGH